MKDELQTITVVLHPTGEISFWIDGSAPVADHSLTLDVTGYDHGGVYLSSDDSQTLADFIAARALAPVPGVKR